MNDAEDLLDFQLRVSQLPAPVREHRFHRTRRWRFDFAWPAYLVAVEVEGGAYRGGRHRSVRGFINDCEKYNEAALAGWLVLRYPTDSVRSGEAARDAGRALVVRGWSMDRPGRHPAREQVASSTREAASAGPPADNAR